MITFLNKTRQPEAINLSHEDVCGDSDDECSCKSHEHRELLHDPRTGETRIRVHQRKISGSLHLLPGIWSAPVKDEIADVPEVAKLLKAGKLIKKPVSALPEPTSGTE